MNTNINAKNETPRRLQTTTCNGQEYFIDERLREFRPVDRPFESVPFNSGKGKKIAENIMLMRLNDHTTRCQVNCVECGKLLFEGTMMEIKRMIIYCVECTTKGQSERGD